MVYEYSFLFSISSGVVNAVLSRQDQTILFGHHYGHDSGAWKSLIVFSPLMKRRSNRLLDNCPEGTLCRYPAVSSMHLKSYGLRIVRDINRWQALAVQRYSPPVDRVTRESHLRVQHLRPRDR